MKPSELIEILKQMDPDERIYVTGFGDRITYAELNKYFTVPSVVELGEEKK